MTVTYLDVEYTSHAFTLLHTPLLMWLIWPVPWSVHVVVFHVKHALLAPAADPSPSICLVLARLPLTERTQRHAPANWCQLMTSPADLPCGGQHRGPLTHVKRDRAAVLHCHCGLQCQSSVRLQHVRRVCGFLLPMVMSGMCMQAVGNTVLGTVQHSLTRALQALSGCSCVALSSRLLVQTGLLPDHPWHDVRRAGMAKSLRAGYRTLS